MSAATTPRDDRDAPPDALARPRANGPLRTLIAMIVVALAFMAVGGQLVRLALPSRVGDHVLAQRDRERQLVAPRHRRP